VTDAQHHANEQRRVEDWRRAIEASSRRRRPEVIRMRESRDRNRDGFVVVDRGTTHVYDTWRDFDTRRGFEPLMSGARSAGAGRLRAYEYMRGRRREVSRERVREESRDRSRSRRGVRFVD
jgi:hypothetical protein